MIGTKRLHVLAVIAATAAAPLAASASAPPATTQSLQTIKAQADAVASGRYPTVAAMQSPARTIGVTWAKIAPSLVRGGALVETKFANQSITAFESDWKSPAKARADAKDVSGKIADLLAAQS